MQIFASRAGGPNDGNVTLEELPGMLAQPGTMVWIDLDPPSAEDMGALAKIFGFHPLEVEDCLKDVELPKLDEFENHVYIITHGLRLDEGGHVLKVELDCFLGDNWLLTSHLVHSRSVASVRERVQRQPEVLARGVDFMLHAVLDAQVDFFMPLIDHFDSEIDRLEEEVLERPRDDLIGEILHVRRQISNVRRSIVPQRDVLGRLARRDVRFVSTKCSIYFRDVHDHVVRVHEMLEAIRDVVGGLTESYRSMISHRMNGIMQRLTTISTLFLPMTFIASIYGMNFHHERSPYNMPELDWTFGYPFALGIMGSVGLGFLWYFKRKQWL